MSPLACQRQLHVDSGSFWESILARCPDPREEAARLTGLSPAVSPGPPFHAPMPPAAVSLALMAPASLCQHPHPAVEQLAVGGSSGTLSSTVSCDMRFGTETCLEH